MTTQHKTSKVDLRVMIAETSLIGSRFIVSVILQVHPFRTEVLYRADYTQGQEKEARSDYERQLLSWIDWE